MERLPNNVHGSNEKGGKPNFIQKGESLYYKFIRYNTKKATSILLFDFDNTLGTADYWWKLLRNKTGLEFSWVTETDSGIQAGIMLDTFVCTKEGFRDRYRIEKIKKSISTLLWADIDIQGSDRLLGIWRNPLQHPTVINSKTYSVKDLQGHFKILDDVEVLKPKRKTLNTADTKNIKMKLSATTKTQKILDNGFHQGNRNNYMYAYGFKTVFENRSKLSSIESILQEENSSYSNSMKPSEISAIARSVEKSAETMYVPTKKEKQPAKYKQFMKDNEIHGFYNRYSFGAYVTAESKRQNTAQDLLAHLVSLFEKGINNPSNREVVEGINIKLRQYQNVKKKYEVAEVFKEWVFGILEATHPLVIRANYMGINLEGFQGTFKCIEKVITAKGKAYFTTRDRFDWKNLITSIEPPLKQVA